MAHPGPLKNSVDVHYDGTPPKLDTVDGLGATKNQRIGTQTLVSQRSQPSLVRSSGGGMIDPTPEPEAVAPVAPTPQPSRVRTWVKWFVDSTVVPAVSVIGTEWLVQCAPEEYQAMLRPLAHFFNATVARPAATWLSDRLVDQLSDPRALLTKTREAITDPRAAVQAVLASLPKQLPSKAQVGRAARELILNSTDTAATVLLLNVAARAADVPGLERALTLLTPIFARTVKGLFDFGFDLLYPMTKVEPEDVPHVDDPLELCMTWPATITKVSGNLDGTFSATIKFDDASPLTGSAVVSTGQQKKIVRITKLADASLVVGGADKYKLSGLESKAYGEHTGWTLAAGKMVAVSDSAPATLERLTISPIGWIDGAFVREGKPGLIGGKAADGAEWPLTPAPTAEASASPLAVSTDSSLAGRINGVIAGHHNKWLLGSGLAVLGWVTQHANLLGQKNPKPKDVIAARESHPTTTWIKRLDPFALLTDIAAIDLVPDFLRTGYPKLKLDPYELKAGSEPSLAFSMTTSLQLFESIGAASATGVTIVWMPFASPTVQLRAQQLKFGDALVVDGLEIDPASGVRTPHAHLRVPLPTDTFSLPTVLLSADYLTVGKEIGFRNASATVSGFTIADVLTVDSFAVSVKKHGRDPRFSAAAKGAVTLPGVKPLTFAGDMSWGGGEAADGSGTVRGAGITEKGFSAAALSGTLTVKKGAASGTLSATDFAIEWHGYTLKTTADVTVDKQGVSKISIENLEVWKAGVNIGSASKLTYDRDQGALSVGKLALDLPETGAIRASKEKSTDATPQLVTTNLDLSSLVKQPDAPAAPKAPAPKTGLAVTNLGAVELGPDPAFLKLDFAKAKTKPAAEGAIAAYVSGDLRRFKLEEKLLQVEHSAKNEGDVKVTLSGMRGTGYSIEAATYDAGILDVTNANIQLDLLLGTSVPDALRGLTSNVKTTFSIDTRANKLLSLTANGSLAGTLFSGAVTINQATADLTARAGSITDGLTDGAGLAGKIAGTMSVKAWGVDATLTGKVEFPSGTPTLSGSGSKDNVAIAITDVTFVDGKPTFGTATAKIAAPMSEVVRFLPSPSDNVEEDDRAKVVLWVAKKVEATADAGMPVAAQSEQLVDPQAPPTREIGVHLPEIHVARDAFVLKADDIVVPEGKDQTVTLGASASLALGVLTGSVKGNVSMKIAGKSPVPDAKSIAFDVASATIGGLTMTGIHYAEGQLKVATVTAQTPRILGDVPGGFGLDDVAWTAKNLSIDIASKTVGAEKLGAAIANISTLGGALTLKSASAEVGIQGAPLGASLIPKNWAITLSATGAKIGTEAFSIGGSAKLVIDHTGLRDGEITEASLAAGVGAASVGKIALTPDGWSANAVKVVVGTATKLGFDPIASLPTWLKTAADCQVQATFPLSYKAGALVWPKLPEVEIDVLKAGIKLPGGISGSFDRTAGKRKASFAAKPPAGKFSVGAQIPLAQGIGIEIGGSLEHQVSLEANDVELSEGDQLKFAGRVAGKAGLKGRVRVGVFGGVPALFTVSAGIYAGLDLNATLSAESTGAWDLPKVGGKDASGAMQMYLSMNDPSGAGTTLTGEAGAYASIHVLGFGRTIEKCLAKAEIASIFAHGFAELSTDNGLRLLPAGAFPTHAFHLHPRLEELLTGGDTKQAIALAYQTVDRGVGKMEASEELLKSAPEGTADTASPWKADKSRYDAAETATARTAKASDQALTTLEKTLKHDRDCLELARERLTKYEKQLASLPSGKTVLGRAAMAGNVEARLGSNYKTDIGRVKQKTQLGAAQLATRIACKKEEIEELERKITTNEALHLTARTQHNADVNANHKATKQAKLAKLSQGDVKKDLAWRQRRLLEMYGTLNSAHKKASNRAAQGAGKTVKLEEDKKIAQQHLERLDADPHASATEKKFWTEQLAFVTAELERVQEEAAPEPIVLSTKTKQAIARAKEKQPDVVAKLSDSVMRELERYEARIEAATLSLSANFEQLAKLADSQVREKESLEKTRTKLLVELHEAQGKLKGALERAEAMND